MDNQAFSPEDIVAIDTETTGLNAWQHDEAFAVSICDGNGNTWYCEWKVDPYTRQVQPNVEDIMFINKISSDPNIAKVFHNAKFDCRMLERHGITVAGTIHDTHIAARVANNDEFTYGLKPLAQKYLKQPADDEADLKEEVKKARRVAQTYNREAAKAGGKLIMLGDPAETDYWLPRWHNPESRACEKYCRLDTFRTMGLHAFYQNILPTDQCLVDGYDFEMFKLWPVINRMELRGMAIDRQQVVAELKNAKKDAAHHYAELVKMMHKYKLKPFDDEEMDLAKFNPGSPKQLRRVLYLPEGKGGLGLFTNRTSDSGELSTDKNALRELMGSEFVQDLVQYRAATQVINLFFEKYLDLMTPDPLNPGGMCIHPGLNQCGTVTFRFSSSNPNIQQVSNPKTAHNVVSSYHPRRPFGPRHNFALYMADYVQQELRLFASISQNPFLLKEIHEGRDPNSSCANKAWGGRNNQQALKAAALALDLGREKPTSPEVEAVWQEIGWNAQAAREFGSRSHRSMMIAEEWLARFDYDIVVAEKSIGRSNSRGRAKNVMFAKVYGGGPSSVTELLYCTMDEARAFMNDYDKVMPEVNQYMQYMIARARKDGYIINPYGRKVRVASEVAYKAVNYMVQSTAACQMKDSMVRCDEYLRETGLDAHVLMTIHDELMFEIAKKHSYRWLLRGLQDIMGDNQGRIEVPTPVEFKRADISWADKVPVVIDKDEE